MNERIKELALQAGMLYTLDSKPTHIDENGTHTFQEINVYKNFDPEKFVELIVIECVRAVRSVDLEDVDGGDEAVINACAENVKKKFGVE